MFRRSIVGGGVLNGQGTGQVRLPGRVRPIPLLVMTLFILVLGMSLCVNSRAIPSHEFLAAKLMPGNPLPNDALCKPPTDDYFRCQYYAVGQDTTLVYDFASGRIASAQVTLHRQTLGDLILMWGRPSGVDHYGYMSRVFWPGRAAHLARCSFQPDTPVLTVEYGTARPTSAWRGFTTLRECPLFGEEKTDQ